MSRRRLVLQLTPLFDLMLVVIFAQYLQLQEAASQQVEEVGEEARARVAAMAQEVESAERRALDAGIQRSQTLAELRVRDETLNEAREENAVLRERIAQAEVDLRERERQHAADLRKLGQAAAALFEIDAAAFEAAARTLEPAEARRLEQELSDLKGASSEAVIRHLREVEEIRKRCDIWEAHVEETGRVVLRLPGLEEPATFWAADAESFVVKASRAIRQAPEPKSLVLILFSYGDATWQARRPVEEGLALLEERLRGEWEQKTFHVAMMGYALAPP